MTDSFDTQRAFLKADLWEAWDHYSSDQKKGLPRPAPQKPYPLDAVLIDLVRPEALTVGQMSVREAIGRRRSRRTYNGQPLSLEELSFLLWATQGISRFIQGGQTVLRTVPSAGARHPFETYLLVNAVEDLDRGLYRYLSVEHKLCFLGWEPDLAERVHDATYEQYVLESAVVFLWTALPYRTEWRYGPLSHKMIAQDVGHVCQNLYLACEAIEVGTCALGAYNQKMMDAVVGVDGDDEFAIYVATVGRTDEP